MRFFSFLPILTLLSIIFWYFSFYSGSFKSLWMSGDREAQELVKSGQEEKAIQVYENQLSIGAIYYKKGEFKKALSIYETQGSKEAFYNRGNTLVMLG